MPARAWPGRSRGSGVGSVSVEGTSFLSVLRQLAEADPGRPALTCAGVTLTRAEFTERVDRLAGLFAARGVAEGSTGTIGLPNSTELVESLFAAWALGPPAASTPRGSSGRACSRHGPSVPCRSGPPIGSRRWNAPPSWTWQTRRWWWEWRRPRLRGDTHWGQDL